jgi:hypothetical protein
MLIVTKALIQFYLRQIFLTVSEPLYEPEAPTSYLTHANTFAWRCLLTKNSPNPTQR